MSPETLTQIGSWASIAGVLLAVIGFGATLYGVFKSKSAAERAEAATAQTRDTILVLNAVDDFSTAVAAFEEIKRLHRANAWVILPDRYSELRKRLVSLRATYSHLSQENRASIQAAIQHLVDLEARVEKALASGTMPANVPKINEIVSTQADKLSELLAVLKMRPRI